MSLTSGGISTMLSLTMRPAVGTSRAARLAEAQWQCFELRFHFQAEREWGPELVEFRPLREQKQLQQNLCRSIRSSHILQS